MVEVYYRPPVNYFEEGSILAVLRRHLKLESKRDETLAVW